MKKNFLLAVMASLGLGLHAQDAYLGNALNNLNDNITMGDARYMGMAGSMGALGGNISAATQNPAGLGVAVASELSFSLTLGQNNVETAFGNQGTSDNSSFDVGQAGAMIVFPGTNSDWKSFTLGVNILTENTNREIFMPRNENITFTDDSDPDNIQQFTFDGYSDNISGSRSKFNIAMGTNYQDKIYLGASLNILNATTDGSVLYRETNDNSGTATVYDRDTTPYFEDANGLSFSLGAIAKVNHNLRLGAAVHSPVWYNNIAEEFLALDDQGFFNAFSDYDLSTGWKFVGSGGIVVGKNLALNADYTFTSNNLDFGPSGNFQGTNQFVDNFVNDTHELRLGGEFRLKDLRLRAGYAFATSPVDDFNIDGGFVNGDGVVSNANVTRAYLGDTNRLSLGLGYNFGGFFIDAAYQRSSHEFGYLFGGSEFIDAGGSIIDLQDVYFTNVNQERDQYVLTLGWKF